MLREVLSSKYVIVAACALGLGLYLNWPAPQLSEQILAWKNGGKFYKFRKVHDIFYRDESGSGSQSEVLVLIHGFPTCGYDWIKNIEKLKHRFGRIIIPDMLGFGFSAKPLDHNYTLVEQADIIQELLHHLSVRKFHILSHDYGDTVAQELLHRHNHKIARANENILDIQSLCLLNGGIFPEVHTPLWSQTALLSSNFRYIFARLSNSYFFFKQLSRTFAKDFKPSKQDLMNWWSILRYENGNLILPNLLQYIPQRVQNRQKWISAIKESSIKVHFIYGDKDPINPHPFAERFRNEFPKATIDTLHGVGHYVQWEAPDEMVSSYFQFLDDE